MHIDSSLREFTIEEVQKHNTLTDCYIILDKKVYNITDFISKHPGGTLVLLKYAGKDITKIYKQIHGKDSDYTKYLKNYYLGTIKK